MIITKSQGIVLNGSVYAAFSASLKITNIRLVLPWITVIRSRHADEMAWAIRQPAPPNTQDEPGPVLALQAVEPTIVNHHSRWCRAGPSCALLTYLAVQVQHMQSTLPCALPWCRAKESDQSQRAESMHDAHKRVGVSHVIA